MKTIKIREPIWKNHSIGIADRELTEDEVAIEITYKRKSDNQRMYPDTFVMKRSIIERYPTMTRKNVVLYIVPIKALDVKKTD